MPYVKRKFYFSPGKAAPTTLISYDSSVWFDVTQAVRAGITWDTPGGTGFVPYTVTAPPPMFAFGSNFYYNTLVAQFISDPFTFNFNFDAVSQLNSKPMIASATQILPPYAGGGAIRPPTNVLYPGVGGVVSMRIVKPDFTTRFYCFVARNPHSIPYRGGLFIRQPQTSGFEGVYWGQFNSGTLGKVFAGDYLVIEMGVCGIMPQSWFLLYGFSTPTYSVIVQFGDSSAHDLTPGDTASDNSWGNFQYTLSTGVVSNQEARFSQPLYPTHRAQKIHHPPFTPQATSKLNNMLGNSHSNNGH